MLEDAAEIDPATMGFSLIAQALLAFLDLDEYG